MNPEINMILSTTLDDEIGYKSGELIYTNKVDMRIFKELTIGNGNNAVIMGRKTYESLKNNKKSKFPLPNRFNIVLSKTLQLNEPNTLVCTNIVECINLINNLNFDKVWVIGGAEIYKAFEPFVKNVVISRFNSIQVPENLKKDTVIYKFPEENYDLYYHKMHLSENTKDYFYVWVYTKKSPIVKIISDIKDRY